jgi:hypothetical protein
VVGLKSGRPLSAMTLRIFCDFPYYCGYRLAGGEERKGSLFPGQQAVVWGSGDIGYCMENEKENKY